MKILIKNANLISMSENREKYEEGIDILIEDKKIIKIEKNIELDDFKDVKIIDANGKIVMPGLINTHAHISMSIFRETVDGLKLQDWLTKKIWPIEDKLTNEDIYWATMLSCLEMIETGCTTANDMYFMTEDIIKAVKESGIRIQTTRALTGNGNNDNTRIDELNELLENYKEIDTVTFNCGIHGFYTSDLEYIRKCVRFAQEKNLIIHIHFCENLKERNDIIEQYNVENPAELIKNEFKGIHNILAHCVKVSNKDIDILKGTNSYISHCPISNLKLGCGIAPINDMLKAGLNVSLGTDGQGSGSNLDMFETMKLAALMQKGINEDPEQMPAYDVLKMATINGAKALNLQENIGSIDEGKQADLIIINCDNVITNPINNIFAQIVYNAKGSNVETTIVNGQILMENREIKHINQELIIENCRKIIKRI